MSPSSILARGEVTEETWFNEIDAGLAEYAEALARASEPGLSENAAFACYLRLRFAVDDLREHGVTVCGGIGHA